MYKLLIVDDEKISREGDVYKRQMRICAEEKIRFIRLQFTDITGSLKNIAITTSQLEKALDNKCMFDGSSIEGFVRIEESDMYLVPDLDSFVIFPWIDAPGRTARLICDVYLSLIHIFQAQARVIAQAQRCVGRDPKEGNLLRRAKNGMQILSILTTWALENAVDTADSMKARGYGLKGRTSFSLYRFDRRDTAAFLGLLVLLVLVFAGAALGENSMQYFPRLVQKEVTGLSAAVYAGYALLCLTPLILDAKEAATWRRLLSKI